MAVCEAAPLAIRGITPAPLAVIVDPPDVETLPASELVTVVAKLESSPRAKASSSRVSRAPGAAPTTLSTAVFTNAVVAICVVFVPAVAVGANGVPKSVGDKRAAFRSRFACDAFASNWVWIADVTPSKYPISVEDTPDTMSCLPEISGVAARVSIKFR